jgi:hypothetical protein
MKKIRIVEARAACEREPLVHPVSFKGGSVTALWQDAALLRSEGGKRGLGLATQSVLWCDREVFLRNSEERGNAIMFGVLESVLKAAEGSSFVTPPELLGNILPGAQRQASILAGIDDLKPTFALNPLVALDNAAWQLFARENGFANLDEAVPEKYRPVFSRRSGRIGVIPLVGYDLPVSGVRDLVDRGCFFMKIKIGSDPDQDGDPEKMLRWDMARLEEIHREIGGMHVKHTMDGRIPYYLDANGRYDGKERLNRLLEHARRIGAFDRIALLEEPFPEGNLVSVRDLGVRIAADESAHSVADVRERIGLGYGAIALKPAAKTLSLTLEMALAAHEARVPCFCADLTVSPVLVDWNKSVAARLDPLPGMALPVFETNGAQHYARWEEMKAYHPRAGAPWTVEKNGVFELGEDFYAEGGGIFDIPGHYLDLIKK